MELILVRHGETDANRQGILMGSVGGPSLNATGRAQADDIAAALQTEPVAHIYTSPAHRARETAEIVSQGIGVPFSEVNDLCEIDVGSMVGLTSAGSWNCVGSSRSTTGSGSGTPPPPGIPAAKQCWSCRKGRGKL